MHKSAETCFKLNFLRFLAISPGFQIDIGGKRMNLVKKSRKRIAHITTEHPFDIVICQKLAEPTYCNYTKLYYQEVL